VQGGEFGRTSYSQGEIKKDRFGRDFRLTDVAGKVVRELLA
jgi:hypothetical protein